MWVAEPARGLGIARRLLSELECDAVAGGARPRPTRDEQALVEAIAMYRSAGYVEVPAFNDEPFAHHWFEKQLPPPADPDNLRTVRVTFVGSGDAFGGGGRFQACISTSTTAPSRCCSTAARPHSSRSGGLEIDPAPSASSRSPTFTATTSEACPG